MDYFPISANLGGIYIESKIRKEGKAIWNIWYRLRPGCVQSTVESGVTLRKLSCSHVKDTAFSNSPLLFAVPAYHTKAILLL